MHWNRIVIASVVGVGLAMSPGDVAAQYLWDNVCGTTSGLTACATAEVSWNSATRTLQMKVWNLEDGTATSGISPSTITKVGLTPTDNENSLKPGEYPTFGSFSVFGYDKTGLYKEFTSYYMKGASALQINLAVETGATGGSSKKASDSKSGGLNGCTDLASGSAVYMYSCGSGNYALFTFNDVTLPTGYADLSEYYFEFHAQQVGNGGSVKGHGGLTTTNVVPEPVSMVLLGSGLFGVGFARRRRRNNAADS